MVPECVAEDPSEQQPGEGEREIGSNLFLYDFGG
jgi:hypothetical protein